MPSPEIISLTKETIPVFVGQITDNLASLGFPGTVRLHLEDFLNTLYEDQILDNIALVSVLGEVPGPRLDFYAIYSHPVNLLDDVQSEEAERIGYHHDKFALSLDKTTDYYGTFIHILDPRMHPSTEALRDHLAARFGVGSSAGVIAVASLTRS